MHYAGSDVVEMEILYVLKGHRVKQECGCNFAKWNANKKKA